MVGLLKSEYLKLLTLRSTYATGLLGLAFILFMSFFVEGLQVQSEMINPNFQKNLITNIASTVSFFAAITTALMMLNEYRYSTITYTLTASRSRLNVLIAKIIVAISYAAAYTTFCILWGLFANIIGLNLADIQLPLQEANVFTTISKLALFGAANGLLGLLFATIFRNITATITALFILPTIVEALIAAKFPAVASYLPFTALNQTVATNEFAIGEATLNQLESAVVFGLYLVIGWMVAFVLFQRRDAK